jgi:E1A/CREB-binding protein
VRGAWCHTCFSDAKGDRIVVEGSINVRKADLIKKKNDEEMEESWVQCDYCEQWVHQICGLFNKGRNDQNVHYLCPECLLKGSRQGLRSRMTERPQVGGAQASM